MKISLKIKLMITFFVLIALPMGILGYNSYKMTSNSIQNTVQEELNGQVSDTSDMIETTIKSVKSVVEVSSLNNQIGKAAQNLSEPDIDGAYEYIKKVQENNKDFMEALIITDSKGKVVVDSTSRTPTVDLSDRDYMKKTLSSGSQVVSEVLTSRFTGNPAIFITYPIKEGDKIIGILVGSIKFDIISSYAAKVKVGNSGYAYMIDKNGLLVYHPDNSRILKDNAADITNDDFKPILNEMKEGKTSDGFYLFNNKYKYVTFKPAGNWVVAVTANYDEYMASAISIKNNTIIISLIAIIVAMIIAYSFSTKEIINPINKLKELMKLAGEGDLTVNISLKNKDEIGELGKSFNDMIKHQEEIVRNVSHASKQLNAASDEMASSSEEISAATQEISAIIEQVAQDAENQNQSIVEASEVLIQLSSLVKLAQNRAQVTSLNAVDTKKVADLGREKVEETVKAMNIINVGSLESVKVLEELSELSFKAEGIIGAINSIAEQTNLLALNAAIEAARAGEHGKGFSVVADEVRKLSEESNNKAMQIAELISEIIKQSKIAVTAMERSKSEVENGVTIVAETDKAFINIIKAIEDIVENVNEILDITGDEVASSDKVVELIDEMATITESNSSNCKNVASSAEEQVKAVESLTATAEETSAMSEELTELVERFKI